MRILAKRTIIAAFQLIPYLVSMQCTQSFDQNDPVEKALTLERRGDTAGALAEYEKMLRKNPNDVVALIDRAQLRFGHGDHKGGFDDINRALKVNMIDYDALRTRGDFKAQTGDTSGANADYNESLKWDSKNAVTYLNRGILREKLGEKKLALADFDKSISLNHNLTAQFHRLRLLPDQKAARAEYQKLLAAKFKDPDDNFALSGMHVHFGYKEKAIAALNLVIAKDAANSLAYFNRAVLLAEMGENQRALSDYDKSIDLDKSNPKAYYNRGLLRETLNDREGSMNDLKHALELDPQLKLRENYPKPFSLIMS